MEHPETSEFKAWFGDSIITNADNTPKVMYHGTSSDFDSFKPKFYSDTVVDKSFYFTTNPQYASGISNRWGKENSVIPVYLSVKNPIFRKIPIHSAYIIKNREKLIKRGFDGVIGKDAETFQNVVVVFYPTQIKSALGNIGKYDSNNPNINEMKFLKKFSDFV